MTPLLKKYFEIKKELPPESVLFCRIGDFFEVFGEDAKILAEKGYTITKINNVLMAGVPYHVFYNFGKELQETYCIFVMERTKEGFCLNSFPDLYPEFS